MVLGMEVDMRDVLEINRKALFEDGLGFWGLEEVESG